MISSQKKCYTMYVIHRSTTVKENKCLVLLQLSWNMFQANLRLKIFWLGLFYKFIVCIELMMLCVKYFKCDGFTVSTRGKKWV